MPTKTPATRLSLIELRKQGWLTQVVERWVPGANIRRDLFGFIDIIAIKGKCTLAIQTTSSSNVSKHMQKMLDSPALSQVIEAGWRVELHGWRKVKLKRGGAKSVYRCRVMRVEVAESDATNKGGIGFVED